MNQEPNAHCQTWELIPWVVNGTATAAQRERVEAHLRTCADCREEFALQQQFHAAMLARPAVTSDPQPALAQLFARLELQGELAPVETVPRRRHRANAWLAAAVVVQAVGLGLLGAALLHRSGNGSAAPAEAGYRTLSSTAPGRAAAAIRLVAAPDMTLATLRQLLGETGLHIVEANTDNSIFGLASVDAAQTANAEFINAALLRLRAQPGVLLAEPVGDAGRAP
ncbi:anti-sigma factor [Tahibacter harae]|uniref:Zf-HC2 domain-containing protein n=1 Tax=Tahibacter harae TaxID=2963937 RepID=A0ABT1QU74_9GAMM|nr:anti-sigma factor [Tahibacter harae]MCQ4165822.1 zf-HC2 domain-containing protein [Tahibacter harae]